MSTSEINRRYVLSDIIIETRNNDSALKIKGTPIVYNRETVLYENDGFILKEIIAPNAAREALKKAEQVLLWNHDSSKPMAARKNNTLIARENSFGVHIEADVSGTQWGREGYEAIKAGIVTQMSFGFYVRSDGQTEERTVENGKRCLKRTIKSFHRIVDFSPVTYPAYRDTSLSARGDYEKIFLEEQKKFSSAYKQQPEKRTAVNLEELEELIKRQEKNMNNKDLNFYKNLRSHDTRAMTTVGGDLSSTTFAKTIKDKAAQYYPLQALADFEEVPYGKTKIPFINKDIDVFSIGETTEYEKTEVNFKIGNAQIKKFGSLCKITEELIFDSEYDLEKTLTDNFSRSMGKYFEKLFINGNGSNTQPHGFLLDCQKVLSSNTNIYNDLINIFNTIKIDYINNCSWLVNKNTFTEILKTKDAAGNLVINYTDGKPHIFGKPVYITFMPENYPLAFGDYSWYKIVETPSTMQRLNQLYSDHGIIGYLYKRFLDGKLIKNDAIIALEGV